MMMVNVKGGADFALTPPVSLFERSYALGPTLTAANYDVAPDGRFLMVKREADSGRLNVVVNWIEALKS
jgi:hypothetical protein